jgi:hypothetical protein
MQKGEPKIIARNLLRLELGLLSLKVFRLFFYHLDISVSLWQLLASSGVEQRYISRLAT